jgi:alkylated DNA repair protein alkB family protein 8
MSLIYTPLGYTDLRLITHEAALVPTVPGLHYVDEFLSEAEEHALVEAIDGMEWTKLTNRRVAHWGFNFLYGSNSYEHEPLGEIPNCFTFLLDRIEERFGIRPDQITANDY